MAEIPPLPRRPRPLVPGMRIIGRIGRNQSSCLVSVQGSRGMRAPVRPGRAGAGCARGVPTCGHGVKVLIIFSFLKISVVLTATGALDRKLEWSALHARVGDQQRHGRRVRTAFQQAAAAKFPRRRESPGCQSQERSIQDAGRFSQDAESGAARLDAVWPPTLVTIQVAPSKYRAKASAVGLTT